MYSEIPMWLSIAFIVGGLVVLAWSADKFVAGASTLARVLGISPFIVGMVIIGFGTSAPELCVSALSGMSGHSDLSLGNAYGSCIFNLAVILGVSAIIRPLEVKPSVTFGASPLLAVITLFSCALVKLGDGFSRLDGVWELVVFALILPFYCFWEQRNNSTQSTSEVAQSVPVHEAHRIPPLSYLLPLVGGLALLVGSSHLLVWGCVDFARAMGVSELMIGLTVVAVGTSLPELASAVASAKRGNHAFVLGNIIGSNLFNTLAVVGVAGTLSPFRHVSNYLFTRDVMVLLAMSLMLSFFGFNWRNPREAGRITRLEGALWIILFLVYSYVMIRQELGV